jgi:hypothetical protein
MQQAVQQAVAAAFQKGKDMKRAVRRNLTVPTFY